MKKVLFLSAMALLSVFTMALSSCNEDEESLIQLDNIEIGHGDKATIGTDIHIECDIKAQSKIKAIEVFMKQIDGTAVHKITYDTGKYIGVLNTTFHEHVVIPTTLPAGKYYVIISVTDESGNTESRKKSLEFIRGTAEVSQIQLLDAMTKKPINAAKPGDAVLVRAKIKTLSNEATIQDIEMEFHGSGEWEVELPKNVMAKYVGKRDVTFEEPITVPFNCKAGKCDFHFVVEAMGVKNSIEVEDFEIK